jgi:hypothetical protein
MTKYTVASQRAVRPEERQVAPIWRGIGCIMILVIPVISYMLAALTVRWALAQDMPVPYQLIGNPVLPPVLYQTGLAPIADFIASQENLYAILLVAVLYTVIIGGIISLVYALIYKVVGPPRYGPLDAPTPNIKVQRYKR